MTIRIAICAVSLAAMSLGACGKQGSLDRPAPLIGERAKAEYRAQRAAAARGAGEASPNSSATSQTNGDYSQPSDGSKDPALKPMRSDPIPGASPSPFSSSTGGLLPDPFNDPNRVPR
jgi:hypothetical protein